MGRLQARPDPLGRVAAAIGGSRPALRPGARQLGALLPADDFSQANDLAAEHPEKLAELKELFWEEAEKHNVLPLLAGSPFLRDPPPTADGYDADLLRRHREHRLRMIPRIYGRSYAIEADLSVPEAGAEGVIVAEADEMGGFSLWVDEHGLLHHSYSMMGVEHTTGVDRADPAGEVTVRMQFDAEREERSAGGTVSLYANDRKIGEGRIEKTVFFRFSGYAGMDIGRDNGLVVDRAYAEKAPYAFTGTVKKVLFDLKPAGHEDEKALHEPRPTAPLRMASAPSCRSEGVGPNPKEVRRCTCGAAGRDDGGTEVPHAGRAVRDRR